MDIKEIAFIRTGFKQKFGIPRQSGLVDEIGYIVFEEEYRNPLFLEGIRDYDYLWLLWGFSENKALEKATVRPPRLGGEKHMGVFATRSPFRPNNIGLSSVKLIDIKQTDKEGIVLLVSGVDMLDNTPIYDIKPYIPYADSHPDARGGFTDALPGKEQVSVVFTDELLNILPEALRMPAVQLLSQDPRAAYDRNKNREFRLNYHGYDLVFEAVNGTLIVKDVIYLPEFDC